jgi:hypothetical protein
LACLKYLTLSKHIKEKNDINLEIEYFFNYYKECNFVILNDFHYYTVGVRVFKSNNKRILNILNYL